MGLKVSLSTIVSDRGRGSRGMKKLSTTYKKWRMATLAVAVFALAAIGLLGYSLLSGGAPASAESPDRVHGRISEELERKFYRSIPERIVETARDPLRGSQARTPESKKLELTVPALDRVDGVPVYDAPESGYEKALHDGVVHVRGTGFPWHDVANVYIAGHRVGYPGTKSDLVFWGLDKLEKGDEIFLTDADGTRYTYEVFEKRVISPDTVSIMRPTRGENIVSLQTCTLPDYSHRLIVQGELKGKG
jgi:sortase A